MKRYNIVFKEDEVLLLKSVVEWAEKKTNNVSHKELLSIVSEKISRKLDKAMVDTVKANPAIDEFPYLRRLPQSELAFFKEYLELYNVNLYHSLAAVFNNSGKMSLDECYDLYYKKYKDKRPLITERQKELRTMIEYVGTRIGYIKDNC